MNENHSLTAVVGEVEGLTFANTYLCAFDVVESLHDFTSQYHAFQRLSMDEKPEKSRVRRIPGNKPSGRRRRLTMMRTTLLKFPSFTKKRWRESVSLNDRPLESRLLLLNQNKIFSLPVNLSSSF